MKTYSGCTDEVSRILNLGSSVKIRPLYSGARASGTKEIEGFLEPIWTQ